MEEKKIKTKVSESETPKFVSPLRKEKITVKYINKAGGIWGDNPRHILAGGMADNASRTFVVPRLSSGMYVNILTDSEKAFLEEYMGLEYNALSVYKKNDNFWNDSNPEGINKVTLYKYDNVLDLSNPEDFIRYKILLANKNYIASSLKEYQDMPKATYQYVMIREEEENKDAKNNMSTTMKCYKEYGKIEDDFFKLRFIVEMLTKKPISKTTKLEFLQVKINELIQADSKMFLATIEDPLIDTKIILRRGVEEGIISNRADYFYIKKDGSPLCDAGQDPTLNVAAEYLNNPKHQDILFLIQAELNK